MVVNRRIIDYGDIVTAGEFLSKGTQVNRFLDELVESRPAARCPLSAKIEIKQTASLIAKMNRLPNSLVGSRREQCRW